MKPRIVIDLDDTLTIDASASDYPDKQPNGAVVQQLRRYRERGYEIVIHTARNMRTYAGSVGKINVHTLPTILDWLERHDVPFDEVVVGKPWCGHGGFYVDDKTIRPGEFIALSPEEVHALIGYSEPGQDNPGT